jgi:hypothetical protein
MSYLCQIILQLRYGMLANLFYRFEIDTHH